MKLKPTTHRLATVAGLLALAGLSYFLFWYIKPRLGLDLRGGVHLVVQVNTDEACQYTINGDINRMIEELKDEGVDFTNIVPVTQETAGEKIFALDVEGVPEDKEKAFKEYVAQHFSGYDLQRLLVGEKGEPVWRLTMTPALVNSTRERTAEQALTTIKQRVDVLGVSEPVVQREGLKADRIVIELPGLDNPEEAWDVIKTVAILEFKIVDYGPAASQAAILRHYNGRLPAKYEIVEQTETEGGRQGTPRYYAVNRVPDATGQDLQSAEPGLDHEYSRPCVYFSLNAKGSSKFARVTSANEGRQLAIILDHKLQSAPVIQSRIYQNGVITGHFTKEEAKQLAMVLSAGSLPASIKRLEERSIGPSLGRDSIRSGLASSGVGMAMVIIFMLFYYRVSGVNAIVALSLNVFLLLAAMSIIKATWTLPGIAGMALTVGMAVDANILIFERIREELRAGKTVRTAIDLGFRRAFWTIFDCNLTTIIAAVFLFIFGTGPVKGFGITLTIGLVANMFTACVISKLIFNAFILSRPGKIEALSI